MSNKLVCDVKWEKYDEEDECVIIYVATEEDAKDGMCSYIFSEEQHNKLNNLGDKYHIWEMQEGIYEAPGKTVDEVKSILINEEFEYREFIENK
jgi:hypothetical protein